LKREQRLQPLAALTTQTERNRATRLGEAERRLADGEERLQELVRYRLEYEKAFHMRATAGAEMRGLREHQVFIARLGEAVRAQQAVLEQLRAECVAARERWGEAATRSQAVGKVMERARSEDLVLEERRSQFEQDEHAMHSRVPR
jgi:flagellar export protein FliJ